MKFLSFFLSLLTLIGASTLQSPFSAAFPLQDSVSNLDPRLVMYVQTFTTPDKQPLSLLPLLEHETKVTHVILASLHLHEEPGTMRLNNDPFDSPVYDVIWDEVRTLQKNGVKVMALLGGAAAGSYKRLNGTDVEVCFVAVLSLL
jgi:hypothetical protein